MQPLYEFLREWNKNTDNFAKVQATYLSLAVVLLFLAAFISLINQSLGQSVLFLAFVAGLTFIGNGVIWSLVRTFVVPRLERSKKPKSRK